MEIIICIILACIVLGGVYWRGRKIPDVDWDRVERRYSARQALQFAIDNDLPLDKREII